MKRIGILSMLLLAMLGLTACGGNNSNAEMNDPIEVEKVEVEDERLELIQDYLTILYYRNDGYKDYVALYADEEDAIGEDTFDIFRENSDLEDSFDTDDIGTIMETMKVEEESDTEATVYWVKHEDGTLENAEQSWDVVKVDGEWKLAD